MYYSIACFVLCPASPCLSNYAIAFNYLELSKPCIEYMDCLFVGWKLIWLIKLGASGCQIDDMDVQLFGCQLNRFYFFQGLNVDFYGSWNQRWPTSVDQTVVCKSYVMQPWQVTLPPNKHLCLHVCSRNLLKAVWKKEKLFVMSNFFFSHSVFYLFWQAFFLRVVKSRDYVVRVENIVR